MKCFPVTNQLKVMVTDHGKPPRSTMTNIRVSVSRDEGDLTFTSNMYSATISENRNVGNTVASVRATPGHNVQYYITGNGNAPEYFYVEQDSGQIKVSKLITDDRVLQTNYMVSQRNIFQSYCCWFIRDLFRFSTF